MGICKALKDIDLKKSPSSDSLEPNLLKVAAVYIAEWTLSIFNQSLNQFLFQTEGSCLPDPLIIKDTHHITEKKNSHISSPW